jgi:hypothetical protein
LVAFGNAGGVNPSVDKTDGVAGGAGEVDGKWCNFGGGLVVFFAMVRKEAKDLANLSKEDCGRRFS